MIPTLEDTTKAFCRAASEVSAHFTVDRDGRFKSEARFSLRGLMIGAKMSDDARDLVDPQRRT